MRLAVITALLTSLIACGPCGTLEIGGQSGFEVFVGDLGRAVPIEGSYRNQCAAGAMSPSSAYSWEADPGLYEDHLEFVTWVDHRNRQIDSAFGQHFWPAFRANWSDVAEGAVLGWGDAGDELIAVGMQWQSSASAIDDAYFLDGQPISNASITWPVSSARLEILSIRPSSTACEDITGQVFIKARYAMEGGPIGDDVDPWFQMEGTDVFVMGDDAFYCRSATE